MVQNMQIFIPPEDQIRGFHWFIENLLSIFLHSAIKIYFGHVPHIISDVTAVSQIL